MRQQAEEAREASLCRCLLVVLVVWVEQILPGLEDKSWALARVPLLRCWKVWILSELGSQRFYHKGVSKLDRPANLASLMD